MVPRRHRRAPRQVPSLLLLLTAAAVSVALTSSLVSAATTGIAWTDMAKLPLGINELTSGMLKGADGEPLVVLAGEGGDEEAAAVTLVLDVNANKWRRGAERPHKGHHMAGATLDNKLYFVGGYLDGATGALQIYDPIDDSWNKGPDCPVNSGAGVATALGRFIYYCGGVADGNLADGEPLASCARYDVDVGGWSDIASMPDAVHHGVPGTDGRLLYVFGGRTSLGNNAFISNDFTQIYDPETDTWRSSSQKGGPAALPAARGGMGNAPYMDGHFYVMGGEKKCFRSVMCPDEAIGLSGKGVFGRVDRYDPVNDIWEEMTRGMDVPRHGMYPVVGPAPGSGGKGPLVAYVCGGGVVQGPSFEKDCSFMSLVGGGGDGGGGGGGGGGEAGGGGGGGGDGGGGEGGPAPDPTPAPQKNPKRPPPRRAGGSVRAFIPGSSSGSIGGSSSAAVAAPGWFTRVPPPRPSPPPVYGSGYGGPALYGMYGVYAPFPPYDPRVDC